MTQKAPSLQQDLRPTMAATGLIALAGAALLGYGIYEFTSEQARRQTVVDAAGSARASVSRLERDMQIMNDHFREYTILRDGGIVGAFPKTVAIDRFEALAASTGVPLRNFALDGRIPIDLPQISGFSTYEPSNHQMRFEADPLHEEALIRLTDELDRSLGGLHALEGCVINQADGRGAGESMTQGVPRLSVRCTINWYVFAERAADSAMTGGSGIAGAPAPTESGF